MSVLSKSSALTIVMNPEALSEMETRAALEAVEARASLAALCELDGKPSVIASQEDYAEVGAVLKKSNDKWKFLDEERKITVTPLNDEVKRVNDWYRPALDTLKSIRSQAEAMMGGWIMKQRQEERRLMKEAEVAAKAVLATAPGAGVAGSEAMAPTQALVAQAAKAAPAKIADVSHKPKWRWVVKDIVKLTVGLTDDEHAAIAKFKAKPGIPDGFVVDALLKAYDNACEMKFAQLDDKAVGTWVKEHGNKDVPLGVEVTEDVGFTVR